MYFDYGYFEEEQLGREQHISVLKRLLPFVRPYSLMIFLSLILVGGITVCEIAIPYFSKIAIDRYIVPASDKQSDKVKTRYFSLQVTDPDKKAVIENYPDLFKVTDNKARISFSDLEKLKEKDLKIIRSNNLRGLRVLTGFFLLIILANFGLNFGQKMIMEYAGQKIMHDLRVNLYQHIQAMSLGFYTRNPVGRLVTRMTNDIQNMHDFFTNFISFVLKDLFMLLGIAVILLTINWKLALISFSVLPLVIFFSKIFAHKARQVFRQLRIKIAEINSNFSETITGMKTIQIYRQEENNLAKFYRLNHENYQAGMRQVRIMAVFMPIIEVLGYLSVAMIIYFGGLSVLNKTLSIGALVAFISYIRMFFRPIRDVAEKFNLLQNALASAERIILILDKEKEAQVRTEWQELLFENTESIKKVELDQVSFGYDPGDPVLKDISLRVQTGEKIALVGPTGSGKTTIISLLAGFYEPQKGKILVNERNLKEWDKQALRSRMALVMQDPSLFSGSIKKNILQGNPNLEKDRLKEILKQANCQELIERLPQGQETEIGESGGLISMGERQLISIARAFARDPDLLILDEATSSIDSQTEQKIQDALARLMEGRTTITIAHRLSTARHADKIYVLHKGRVVEVGSHKDLVSKQGFYYRLVQMQNGWIQPNHQ